MRLRLKNACTKSALCVSLNRRKLLQTLRKGVEPLKKVFLLLLLVLSLFMCAGALGEEGRTVVLKLSEETQQNGNADT